jgi:hypothetical protein
VLCFSELFINHKTQTSTSRSHSSPFKTAISTKQKKGLHSASQCQLQTPLPQTKTSFLGDLLSGKTQGVKNFEASHPRTCIEAGKSGAAAQLDQIKNGDLRGRALRKDFEIRERRYVMLDFPCWLRRLLRRLNVRLFADTLIAFGNNNMVSGTKRTK